MSFKNNGPGGCCCGCLEFFDDFENGVLWTDPDGRISWNNRNAGTYGALTENPFNFFASPNYNSEMVYSEAGSVLSGNAGYLGVYRPKDCRFGAYMPFLSSGGVVFSTVARVAAGNICFGWKNSNASNGGGTGILFGNGYAVPLNNSACCGGNQIPFDSYNGFDITVKFVPHIPKSMFDCIHIGNYYGEPLDKGQFRITATDSAGTQINYLGICEGGEFMFAGCNTLRSDAEKFWAELTSTSRASSFYDNGTSFENTDCWWTVGDVLYNTPSSGDYNPLNRQKLAIAKICDPDYPQSTLHPEVSALASCPSMDDYYVPANYVLSPSQGGTCDTQTRPLVRVTASGGNSSLLRTAFTGRLDELDGYNEKPPYLQEYYTGLKEDYSVNVNVPSFPTIYTYRWTQRWAGFVYPYMFRVIDIFTGVTEAGAIGFNAYYWYCGDADGGKEFGDFDFSGTDPDYAASFSNASPSPTDFWNATGNLRFKLELV